MCNNEISFFFLSPPYDKIARVGRVASGIYARYLAAVLSPLTLTFHCQPVKPRSGLQSVVDFDRDTWEIKVFATRNGYRGGKLPAALLHPIVILRQTKKLDGDLIDAD